MAAFYLDVMKRLCCLLLLLQVSLLAVAQERYAIVISELMADPTPSQGMPENEWIELTNMSNTTINLQGYRIGDASSQSGAMPVYLLQPGARLIICSSGSLAAMSVFGPAIAVSSFPSLDNDGDIIYLKSREGLMLHAINYNTDWYQNELKEEGGWSLEMIDLQNPCSGKTNWKASTDTRGGTPGHVNTVAANNPDRESPNVVSAYLKNSTTVVLVFDEPIDSVSASYMDHYISDNALTFSRAIALAPLYGEVELHCDMELQPTTIYTIEVFHLRDCSGNAISADSKIRIGIPAIATNENTVINEILFDPPPNGYDYVELYVKGNEVIDLSQLYLANRSSNGQPGSLTRISDQPFYIFPKEYIVLTMDPDRLALQYHVKDPTAVCKMKSTPSFPDDNGTVVIVNQQGEIVDEVDYHADWHFALIDNPEGISLERTNPAAASNDPANWHSAASTAGYGTPGYKNSQLINSAESSTEINVYPSIFSPDNDGFDDICVIQYKLKETGFVANLIIYDIAGRPVRRLVQNAMLSYTGSWTWDGLNDNRQALPIGPYVVYVELFNLTGIKKVFKKKIILARKLR